MVKIFIVNNPFLFYHWEKGIKKYGDWIRPEILNQVQDDKFQRRVITSGLLRTSQRRDFGLVKIPSDKKQKPLPGFLFFACVVSR